MQLSRLQCRRSISHGLAVAAALLATPLLGQEMTTGDGLLTLRAQIPQEVRAGEQFTYTVTVTNASDNIVLHDIELAQRKAQGFSVESVSVGQQGQNQNNRRQNSQGNNQSQDNQGENQQGQNQNEDKQSNQQANNQSDQQKQQDGQQNNSRNSGNQKNQRQGMSGSQMKIATLQPGESRQIQVKAAADQEGELRSCLEVVSYKPAICLTSRVVKPELTITKKAPQRADRCEVIELTYTVTNDGSGDLGAFQIVDELGDGLATIDGENKLTHDVDTLKAGETRSFLARVYATKPGEFSSRAVAKAKQQDLKARSAETTTTVTAADLQASLEGPGRVYDRELVRFTAKVTNTGNAPAEDVRVNVFWPQDARLVDIGEPSMNRQQNANQQGNNRQGGNQQANNENRNNDSGQAVSQTNRMQREQANNSQGNQNKNRQGNNQNAKNSNQQQVSMDSRDFVIDRLDPGQTAMFEYAIRANDVDKLPTRVEAVYVCAVDQAEAREEVTAQAMTTTQFIRLPALQMMVVDDEDPAPKGSEIVYTIRVWNEGNAADKNLVLTAELPKNGSFVDASGPTKHSSQGQTVEFEPLDTIAAGDSVDYKVTVKNDGEGDARFVARMKTDSLDSDVIGEEPTRLLPSQQ